MKIVRQIGSLAFVVGLFTVIFAGIPWWLPTSYAAAADHVDPPKVFSGTLRDDAGNPVANAKITAKNVGAFHMVRVQSVEATTDEQGGFSLQTGFYPVWLYVRSEVGTMNYAHNSYYSGRSIPLPLLQNRENNLVLMRWAQVSGKVVDQKTGKPVRDFRVHFHASMSHAPRKYESKDGRFVEARVTPGMHTITVLATGYAPTIVHAVAVRPGFKKDIGVIRMTSGPTLKGRVLSKSTGQPIADAAIRFRDPRGHAVVSYPPDELTATTDVEGRFSVSNMPLLTLEVYTSIEKPEHRTLTIGTVDMSLALNDTVDALFFLEVQKQHLPQEH